LVFCFSNPQVQVYKWMVSTAGELPDWDGSNVLVEDAAICLRYDGWADS
jgi:hypothetical protein